MISMSFIAAGSLVLISALTVLIYKIPFFKKNIHLLLALAAGSLLSNAVVHILPEGIEESGGWTFGLSLTILAAILFQFFLESFLRWRECCEVDKKQVGRLGILNLAGDFLCNITDGIAIASSFAVNPALGLVTTGAIILHELPQEIGDYAAMIHSGFKTKWAFVGNLIISFGHFIGVGLAFSLLVWYPEFLPYMLAIAGGSALYLSLSTLVPEVHNSHKGKLDWRLILFFVAGLVIVTLTKLIETH